jgi:hypothetical protein
MIGGMGQGRNRRRRNIDDLRFLVGSDGGSSVDIIYKLSKIIELERII